MKAITIRQPWASLIKENIKRFEIRSWKTNYRGEVFIHAGSGIDKQYLSKYKDIVDIDNLPKGKIIAKASIIDCILLDEDNVNELNRDNNQGYKINMDAIGKYAFVLSNIKSVNYDNEVKGQLGLWNIEI